MITKKRNDEKPRNPGRRTFLKKAGLVTAGALGASLFDPRGTPFFYAQVKEPIKFGYPEVLSGVFASQGTPQTEGARFAEKHINAQGGILGRPLKILVEDTEGKVEKAARIAKRMILEEGAVAINGDFPTGTTVAICKVCKDLGAIYFKYESDGSSIYKVMHKLAFHLGDNGPVLSRALVRLALEKFPNAKRWAIMVPDYAWGHDALKDLQEAMTKFSQTKMDVKTLIHPQGCPDFSSYILQIEDYKPDILVTFTFSSDFVTFLRQQKPYKLYQKTIGLHWGSSCGVANSLGKDMEPMWSGLMHGHPSLPAAKKFDEMFFKETGKHVPEDTTAQYYESVFILKKAIEMAKSAKPEDIARKMEGLEYSGYAGKFKINPVSHLVIRSHYYMGYLSPVPDLPYFGAKEIYSIPYDKVMVTDQEAKERYGAAFPYTS